MGRQGPLLVPFLQNGMINKKYRNLISEDESGLIFSIVLPRKTKDLQVEDELLFQDWYSLNGKEYVFHSKHYTDAKQAISASLRKSNYVERIHISDDKLAYRILNKAEIKEKKKQKKDLKKFKKEVSDNESAESGYSSAVNSPQKTQVVTASGNESGYGRETDSPTKDAKMSPKGSSRGLESSPMFNTMETSNFLGINDVPQSTCSSKFDSFLKPELMDTSISTENSLAVPETPILFEPYSFDNNQPIANKLKSEDYFPELYGAGFVGAIPFENDFQQLYSLSEDYLSNILFEDVPFVSSSSSEAQNGHVMLTEPDGGKSQEQTSSSPEILHNTFDIQDTVDDNWDPLGSEPSTSDTQMPQTCSQKAIHARYYEDACPPRKRRKMNSTGEDIIKTVTSASKSRSEQEKKISDIQDTVDDNWDPLGSEPSTSDTQMPQTCSQKAIHARYYEDACPPRKRRKMNSTGEDIIKTVTSASKSRSEQEKKISDIQDTVDDNWDPLGSEPSTSDAQMPQTCSQKAIHARYYEDACPPRERRKMNSTGEDIIKTVTSASKSRSEQEKKISDIQDTVDDNWDPLGSEPSTSDTQMPQTCSQKAIHARYYEDACPPRKRRKMNSTGEDIIKTVTSASKSRSEQEKKISDIQDTVDDNWDPLGSEPSTSDAQMPQTCSQKAIHARYYEDACPPRERRKMNSTGEDIIKTVTSASKSRSEQEKKISDIQDTVDDNWDPLGSEPSTSDTQMPQTCSQKAIHARYYEDACPPRKRRKMNSTGEDIIKTVTSASKSRSEQEKKISDIQDTVDDNWDPLGSEPSTSDAQMPQTCSQKAIHARYYEDACPPRERRKMNSTGEDIIKTVTSASKSRSEQEKKMAYQVGKVVENTMINLSPTLASEFREDVFSLVSVFENKEKDTFCK